MKTKKLDKTSTKEIPGTVDWGFSDFAKAADLSFIEEEIVRSRKKIEGTERLTLKALGVKFSLTPERIRQKYMLGMTKLSKHYNTSKVSPTEVFNEVFDLYRDTAENLALVNLVNSIGSKWDREIKRISPEAQEFLKTKFCIANSSAEVVLLLLSTDPVELQKMSSDKAYYRSTKDSDIVKEVKGMLNKYGLHVGSVKKNMTDYIRYNPLRDILM